MKYIFTDKQLEQLEKWKATLPKPPPTAIGGAFTYLFTPTGIGTVVVVKYWDGQEINLTDYDEW